MSKPFDSIASADIYRSALQPTEQIWPFSDGTAARRLAEALPSLPWVLALPSYASVQTMKAKLEKARVEIRQRDWQAIIERPPSTLFPRDMVDGRTLQLVHIQDTVFMEDVLKLTFPSLHAEEIKSVLNWRATALAQAKSLAGAFGALDRIATVLDDLERRQNLAQARARLCSSWTGDLSPI